jgi:hypothetical protein
LTSAQVGEATDFSYIKQYSNQSGLTEHILWGTASISNIEILERLQLRMIVDAPWYVPNTVIRRDLQTPIVKEEIRRYSSQYSARLSSHPNGLIVNLIDYQIKGDCEETCQIICVPDS